jgi:cytochrome c553
MNPARRRLLVLALACLPPPMSCARADGAGDAVHGGQQVAECSACHGRGGEGVAASAFPRLAGQQATYLIKQLQDYAAGTRHHAVMAYFAKKIGPQTIADIGAWYASLSTPAAPADVPAADTVLARGSALVTQGDTAAGVPACASCHGPDGKGGLPGVPYIGGQHAEYLVGQLEAWRDGSRHNDAGGQMATVARRLNATDVAAVGAWLSRLAPPQH